MTKHGCVCAVQHLRKSNKDQKTATFEEKSRRVKLTPLYQVMPPCVANQGSS